MWKGFRNAWEVAGIRSSTSTPPHSPPRPPHQCSLLMEELSCPAQGGGLVLSPELKANCSCIHSAHLSLSICLGAVWISAVPVTE